MKKRKSEKEPAPPALDPSHPNYDAILLKRARLEAHRRRRRENRGEEPAAAAPQRSAAKRAKKPRKRSDD